MAHVGGMNGNEQNSTARLKLALEFMIWLGSWSNRKRNSMRTHLGLKGEPRRVDDDVRPRMADGDELKMTARRQDQHGAIRRRKDEPAASQLRYEARRFAYGDGETVETTNRARQRLQWRRRQFRVAKLRLLAE